MKASAIAHPIQGIVKYHGLQDRKTRTPFHDSVSLCTGPIRTHTTFEPAADTYVKIDGEECTGRALARVRHVVEAVQKAAGTSGGFHMESHNDFPQFVGLGSSSSGFAALAMAACAAYDYHPDLAKISTFARLGAGSACRAVTGGLSRWDTKSGESYQMLAPDALDWRIVVPLVRHEEPTDNVHDEVLTSPLFAARVDYISEALNKLDAGIANKSLAMIGQIAETDTLNLHAITMTGEHGHITWQPATLEVMHRVRQLRRQGVPVWFSIDTGATAYLNTNSEHEALVAAAMQDIDGVSDIMLLHPAGAAHLVDEHLF